MRSSQCVAPEASPATLLEVPADLIEVIPKLVLPSCQDLAIFKHKGGGYHAQLSSCRLADSLDSLKEP